MGKKLTILDIARLSGVSKSTVSRVLTNAPRVNPETRAKVEKVIADNDYVPSKSAQSMRKQNQKVIGVIISRLDSPSENRAVSSMLNVFYANDYDAVIMESQFDPDKVSEHLAVLEKRQVDGVVLFGFSGLKADCLKKWKHRIITISMDAVGISSINYDNYGVISHILEYLKKKSLRNISYIGVDPIDKTTGYLRLNAYLDWCNEYSVSPCYRTGKLRYESAYQLVDEVLHPETEAIVCASDTLALGVIKRLQECQRNDVMVAGVGGSELLSFLFPKVYSIDPGYREAGTNAANQLIKQLKDRCGSVCLTQSPNF
ncbi:trehalose operon repressor TreR [Vibrio salinus]|uniref:trehalose operon repressor TreR n=1 Tax=Vibrio salinus TaxID=2899784 RepID=UPI001E394C18|nr:trehalose operon repressor TreR [Vibrio salinus]MCE0493037.1 trehalose operon repressor TreR [Vibrio salinus]